MRKFLYSLFGFLNGCLLLHPISMVLFVNLAKHENPNPIHQGTLMIILSSFSPEMLPMALGFGLLGVVVSLIYEGQSSRLAKEKNRLRWELARGKALMDELEYRTQQLNEQKQKLLDLQRMRERTIRFLVHDFKNQLGCIKGFSEILLGRPTISDDPDIRSPLVRIHRQAKVMITGIRNLLDIARLEEKSTLRKELLSPVSILQSVATEDYAAHSEYEISITPETINCPSVFAEQDLIRRVILNLVSNAIKHQRPDVRIMLSAGPDPSDQAVVFTCRDDGEPISPDVQPHLFKAYRVGGEMAADSTGLGLAFTKAAVEAHGGRIWYDGSEQNGNSFHFTIPLERRGEMQTEKQRNVLVVEDEPDFSALLESMLRGLGFEVQSAFNAEDALTKMEAQPPDMITLDVKLPSKSGLLFYRQIKNREKWRDIPVIVISGLPAQDPEWRGFMKTFMEVDHVPAPQAYLDKPINRDDLETTIKNVLGDDSVQS
ncbi:MAG: response regulator [Candidatus Latescibacteria bacterium]|nr:response regulator [Candidatus Latescibacterota bacterium]NIO29237.1 response regulator [Candidatus Latescibacterota bacterium]NIO56861.1 response regulator [Candidatus Latescibacterota bacterium]